MVGNRNLVARKEAKEQGGVYSMSVYIFAFTLFMII